MNNERQKKSFGAMVAHTKMAIFRRLLHNFKLAGYTITPEQWQVLIRLFYSDGICQQELADFTHRDRPGITRILDNMEKNNLITRMSQPEDRRKKAVYLTEYGKSLGEKLEELANTTNAEALAGIDESELEICRKVLLSVQENLD